MNYEKIGKFLQELRIKKGYSQEKIADLLFVTRQVVSKWERGKSLPNYEMLASICKLYDISANEILAGEKSNAKNKELIENVAVEVLKDRNIRLKKLSIMFTTIVGILLILFLSYYFISTYNKMKVYVFSGESEHFYLNNGVMMMSNEQIYFNFGHLLPKQNEKYKDLEIYYTKEEERILITHENTDDIFIYDYAGYNQYFNFNDLKYIIENLYLDIEYDEKETKETMKINISERYTNKSLIFNDSSLISSNKEEKEEAKDSTIPEKIEKEFQYISSEEIYSYTKQTENYLLEITYEPNNQKFNVFEKYLKYEKVWIYDFKDPTLKIENFMLNNKNDRTTLQSSLKLKSEIICNQGECSNHKSEYDYFRKKYKLVYIPDF